MSQLHTIATPHLWALTVAVLLGLLAADFAVTRRPHEVAMREAAGWSLFYLALPAAFGFDAIWWTTPVTEFITAVAAAILIKKQIQKDKEI